MPTEADHQVLLNRAADGDLHAAGEVLLPLLPGLIPAARRLAGDTADPEDLLAEAVAAVLSMWAARTGPRDGVRNYLLQTMRNRAIDEATSPRARTRPLDFDVVDLAMTPPDAAIDLEHELDALRLALTRLPAAQRELLIETYHGGAPPTAADTRQHRSAGAIHSQRSRAKMALRRAYLQVMLEEGAPPSCQHAISTLPAKIAASPEETDGVPAHTLECNRCRKGWRRFAAVWATLGIVPLCVLATAKTAPVTALAAEPGHAAIGRTEPSPEDSAHTIPGQTGLGSSAVTSTVHAKPLLLAGAALCTVGVAIAAVAAVQEFGTPDTAISAAHHEFAPDNAQPSQSDVAAQLRQPGSATHSHDEPVISGSMTLHIDEASGETRPAHLAFNLDHVEWSVKEVTFLLPAGVTLADAPAGWNCDDSTCHVDTSSAIGGTFIFQGAAADGADFTVQWVAHSGGSTITSTVGGPFPPENEALSARAET